MTHPFHRLPAECRRLGRRAGRAARLVMRGRSPRSPRAFAALVRWVKRWDRRLTQCSAAEFHLYTTIVGYFCTIVVLLITMIYLIAVPSKAPSEPEAPPAKVHPLANPCPESRTP